MSNPSSTEPVADKVWVKSLGRRRVFAFFWVFALVAISNTVVEENDIFLHVVDDYADIIFAVVAIIVLALWWKKDSMSQLKMTNNIMAVLAVALILATIFAITQELCPAGSTIVTCDPADFGNEIPTLFFGIFMLINRFV